MTDGWVSAELEGKIGLLPLSHTVVLIAPPPSGQSQRASDGVPVVAIAKQALSANEAKKSPTKDAAGASGATKERPATTNVSAAGGKTVQMPTLALDSGGMRAAQLLRKQQSERMTPRSTPRSGSGLLRASSMVRGQSTRRKSDLSSSPMKGGSQTIVRLPFSMDPVIELTKWQVGHTSVVNAPLRYSAQPRSTAFLVAVHKAPQGDSIAARLSEAILKFTGLECFLFFFDSFFYMHFFKLTYFLFCFCVFFMRVGDFPSSRPRESYAHTVLSLVDEPEGATKGEMGDAKQEMTTVPRDEALLQALAQLTYYYRAFMQRPHAEAEHDDQLDAENAALALAAAAAADEDEQRVCLGAERVLQLVNLLLCHGAPSDALQPALLAFMRRCEEWHLAHSERQGSAGVSIEQLERHKRVVRQCNFALRSLLRQQQHQRDAAERREASTRWQREDSLSSWEISCMQDCSPIVVSCFQFSLSSSSPLFASD